MTSVQAGVVLQQLRRLAEGRRPDQAPDGQLLERFTAHRDEAAFAGLVRRHGPMVLGVCRSVLRHEQDAEDAFQATFLVLARKAGSIRQKGSVAGWLYEVAYRVALKAHAGCIRRRAHERRASEMAPADPTLDMTLRDLQRVLHEELRELPDRYRVPLVLCYLEGLSHEEAARQLGWTKGALRGRLDRGREHVRRRLTRRGVTLSAALGAAGLALKAPAARAALVEAVVRAAMLPAADGAVSAVVSARAAALADGVARVLPAGKAKGVSALLLLAGLVAATAGALAHHVFAAPKEELPTPAAPPRAEAPRPAPAATDEKGKTVDVSGRVLDPDGKPFAGAKVCLVAHGLARQEPVRAAALSMADGTFRLSVARRAAEVADSDPMWHTDVIATAKGYGAAVSQGEEVAPSRDLTLRLVRDDVPVRGRVLDLQGKPLAGVTVRVGSLTVPAGDDLTSWLEALRANPRDAAAIDARFLEAELDFADSPGPFPEVVTDADGRFQLRGLGRERVAELTLRGTTIAQTRISVRTRPGKPVVATLFGRNPEGPRLTYYGATFDHVAGPTRPIVGTVRDQDTGKPMAGVTVESQKFAGVESYGDSSVRTVTDKDGRYRLVGMPKGHGNMIKAAPAPGQPYLQAEHEVQDGPGLEPVTVDFALKRGVVVKGRVLDRITGRPVVARVLYVVFEDNPHHKDAPHFTNENYLDTPADGSFEVVAFPGRGLLAARGWSDHYRIGVGADRIAGKDPQGLFLTAPFLLETNTMNRYREIDPAEGTESMTCDLLLDPSRMPGGTVLGPDGKPLAGAQALGLTAYGTARNWTRQPLPTADFTVYGLDDGAGRDVLFVHPEKHLASLLRVGGADRGPLSAKLGPWGAVTGRLVSAEGKPQAEELMWLADWLLPNSEFQTDRDGRFRVEGLVPGVAYTLDVVRNGKGLGHVFAGLNVKAGETRDLGDVRPEPISPKSGE
jgi:RNA polymerase sigma factor (sigma-70 family)